MYKLGFIVVQKKTYLLIKSTIIDLIIAAGYN
jgi:hypothetical protein